ncbi:abc-2 type transporter : ABC transporter, ATP-binding subunit, PltJ-like OS=Sulfurospirillum multivorans DSM 12446 GN=SMUL_1322 PE=4 SV=1: ABC2_membrane_3 [Gemmata massiliana]|uniref:ABC transmembrane type-2 domain-containing protein n=1 Tax=Gemmata massiliana TaxID=1210884 RepID=A0A6P2DPY8_9BACT|nr:ABC transporter permease [Gemmata massiliana]VTS03382.1 abc-2 type transporter : ABC transporter, ATP-binding subunit, PltJ-like OS=Sulfurospirillum multivorans DSM 12446 GN=SMUL_1322 PE=4 SV=1: ABC2_membrane_3 [Gemmata massiliana]
MSLTTSLRRTASVARKEFLHMFRDRGTLFFALAIPVLELIMLGYAVDTNVRHIRTVIFDAAQTQESRELLRAFENSDDFDVVEMVYRDDDLTQRIVAGKAHVAVKIPENYSRQLQAGQTAQLLVLVDGSESSVASTALNVSNAIALQESLKLALSNRVLPVESRPRILFNPDTRSANFFIPGLMVFLCQMMASMLTANAIVREKELGTLEQLFMTPVRPGELMVGKLVPYLVLSFVQFLTVASLMRAVFQVPIAGSFPLLLAINLPFVVAALGIGLLISAKSNTREEAGQKVMGSVLPCVFLSGYIFPIESMPALLRPISHVIPTTWMIDAARGVILRGAGWAELWQNAAILSAMAFVVITLAAVQFKKRVS